MSTDVVRAAYDEVADTYADHFRSTEPEAPVDLAMIDLFTTLLPGPRVLDAGCGAGRMMPLLAGLGCAVVGVDLSPAMVGRARRDHAEFPSLAGSVTDLPFAEGSFDGVMSWYSTIHLDGSAVRRACREMARVLRPGGIALLAFQTGTGVRDVGPSYAPFGHDITLPRWSRSPDDVAAWLADAGLVERARMQRCALAGEKDGQGIVVAALA